LIDANLAALPSNEISTSKIERKGKKKKDEMSPKARRGEAKKGGEDKGTDPEERGRETTPPQTRLRTDDGVHGWIMMMNRY